MTLIWLLALISTALAARLELAMDVDQLSVGQTVALQVQLVDGKMRGVPEVPVGQGLHVQYQSQMTSKMVVNFKSTRIVRYTYAVTAVQEGSWEVGPVVVDASGEQVRADPLTVTVRPKTAEERAASQVTGTLSDTEPFLGEVVVYTFRYQHKDRVLDARWTAPDFDGFVPEKTSEASQKEYTIREDGDDFSVQEIAVPLVAVGDGERVIPPAALTTQVPVERSGRSRDPWRDEFFGRMTDVRTVNHSTEPISLSIRALPVEGRPADYSGLVGQFAVQATPSARSVPLGESITLDVVVAGTGTLAGFRLPAMPADSGFRAYDDDPDVRATVQDGAFRSSAHFRRAIVPETEGRLTLPPLDIPVFDPATESYVRLKTEPIVIDVGPGEGGGEVSSFAGGDADARHDVEALGDDILPVPGNVTVRDRTLSSALPLAVGLPAMPGLALVGLWLAGVMRSRKPDPWEVLRGRLGALPVEPAGRLAALEDIFRDAASLRLGRPAPGLDRAAFEALGDEAVALYDAVTTARYGGGQVARIEERVRAFVAGGEA